MKQFFVTAFSQDGMVSKDAVMAATPDANLRTAQRDDA